MNLEGNVFREITSDRDAAVSRSTKDLTTLFLFARPARPQAVFAAEDDDDDCVPGSRSCQ